MLDPLFAISYCTIQNYFLLFPVGLTHDRPTNLTFANITSRSAEISWLDPQNLGRYGLSRFRIKLRKGKSLILSNRIRKVNEYKLDNLTPFTTYEISIVAGNHQGYSGETITSFVTLEEGKFFTYDVFN